MKRKSKYSFVTFILSQLNWMLLLLFFSIHCDSFLLQSLLLDEWKLRRKKNWWIFFSVSFFFSLKNLLYFNNNNAFTYICECITFVVDENCREHIYSLENTFYTHTESTSMSSAFKLEMDDFSYFHSKFSLLLFFFLSLSRFRFIFVCMLLFAYLDSVSATLL